MNQERVVKAGLLGLGTVGSGVYKLVERQKNEMALKAGAGLEIQKILVHNINKKREGVDQSLLTDKWEDIMNDDEIEIVIEVMGGIEPARTMILEALHAGKNVVTANKDLVATHGHELLEAAEESGVDFLFEAAVAGAIPIIRPLKQCLAANEIQEVIGIVNGTTNFILTKMIEEGMDFDDALALATELGYAEADPTADIEGLDAGRKVAIMASIAFHSRVTFDDVYTEGITKITAKDVEYAEEFGDVIKLLGVAHNTEEGIEVAVHPMMIPKEHPLASVRDSFNAVFVRSDAAGDTMFYGRGAGELPTASAIMGDVIDVIRRGCIHGRRHHIVVVAEGVGHVHEYAQTIEEETGLETRVTVLGYIQRGGAPSGRDRVSAAMMGVRAIDVLKSDASSRVIVERNGRFEDMDIEEALQMKRELDEEMFVACNRIDTSYQYHHKKTT